VFGCFLRHQQRAQDIDVELAVKLLGRHALQRLEAKHSRVVDDDVRRAKLASRRREQPLYVCRLRDIALNGDSSAIVAHDLRHHALRARWVGGIVHHHGGACRSQRLRDAGPDALRCARHHCHLAL
jgi:hypothetical protein